MSVVTLSRREFLGHGFALGSGLVLGVGFPATGLSASLSNQPRSGGFAPDAFVRVGSDGLVTVIVKHIEFGQGTFTGLPTLVADELDADWSQIRAEGAPADPTRYSNLNWGDRQGTGGSSSMNNAFIQMRRAGASARAMLVAAAARAWQVKAGEITVRRGVLRHAGSGREAGFGEFAAAAAREPVPKNVTLKQAEAFVYIGRDTPRLDMAKKTDGSAIYTQDLRLPGMLTALVLHPPRFGARIAEVDDGRARSVAGVRAVLHLPTGVAVVARDFWTAKKARELLTVRWDQRDACRLSSSGILADYRALAQQPGMVARSEGDAEAALDAAERVIEAEYTFPFLAHAAMEPMNCIARFSADGCDLWYGVQNQSSDLNNLSAALGLPPETIRLHMLYAGGSFGRRSDMASDYVVEAARIARELPEIPVKLFWTREDDMRAGAFRPLNLHRLRGALDDAGGIAAWHQRIVGQSLLAAIPFRNKTAGVDRTCVQGAADLPYALANLQVESHQPELGVPILWWRSVGHTHTAFSTEVFIDELAHAAGRDPLTFRRTLLADDPRRLAVLERAAREAGWNTPLPVGRGRGIAVHYSFKTYVAEVAEVTMQADGGFVVDRVVAAVDCGLAVNPSIVRAQIEGGIGYALSAALGDAITLKDGLVQEDNFDTYPVLRLSQMPAVDVHIIDSNAAPTGVGEPGVPPLAPAVANAVFAACGQRLRSLPLPRRVA